MFLSYVTTSSMIPNSYGRIPRNKTQFIFFEGDFLLFLERDLPLLKRLKLSASFNIGAEIQPFVFCFN